MSKKVFLSHSHSDRALAQLLQDMIEELSNSEIEVWSSSDSTGSGGVEAGDRWRDRIKTEIDNSKALIALLSPQSFNSPWIYFECGLGEANSNVRIIPVCIGLNSVSDVPSPLKDYEIYRLFDADSTTKFFAKVFNALDITFNETIQKGYMESLFQRLMKSLPSNRSNSPSDDFPQLYKTLMQYRSENPKALERIDKWASQFLEEAALAMGNIVPFQFGIDRETVYLLPEMYLKNCKSIMAVDTLGPQGWLSHNHYRYLVMQLRRYLRANIIDNNKWDLSVSKSLGQAINGAINVAKSKKRRNGEPILPESITEFDNPCDFQWQISQPRVEYSRILYWTREQLLSPIAETVISIHEAFHVPLFFREINLNDDRRKFSFIAFAKTDNDVLGFYFKKPNWSQRNTFKNDNIPTFGKVTKKYEEYLGDDKLMLALDARHILGELSQDSTEHHGN